MEASAQREGAEREMTVDVEQIMEYVCDNLCRYPGEYKDPDELWSEQCDRCRLRELLVEGEDDG